MKAVSCRAFGPVERLTVEEVPDLSPAPGQVVIQVRACGVNFPDSLMVQGMYQVKPPFPFSPGLEAAGLVAAVGADVIGLAAGRRVLAFCGAGGMAEELAVDSGRVIPIPDAMDFTTAGGFAVTYGTAHHALKDRARLQPGETLLVLGAAGGVGLAAVEIGKALGARVIACASSDEKLALCRSYGADDTINYTAESLRDRLKVVMAGKGVDVVFDPVGGDFSEAALRGLAWMGRYLVVGFAAGDIPRIPLNLVLLKSAALLGVAWGAAMAADPAAGRAGLMELLSWFEAGRLKPHISATYPLDRAAEAIAHVAGRNAKGKVVIVVA